MERLTAIILHALFVSPLLLSTLLSSLVSLTYAVAEDDGQNHSYPHGAQGGALP